MNYVSVGLMILLGYCVHPIVMRRAAVMPGRARNLVFQYFFAAIFSLVAAGFYHWLTGANFQWQSKLLLVFGIGIGNGIACYFQWKAVAINQALTSISTWLDDVIALTLGFLILSEFQYLNPLILVGISLAIISSVLFATQKNSLEGIEKNSVYQIYKYILIYSLIWGAAMFSMRYFSLKAKISVWDFLPVWYFGSLTGALLVYATANASDKGERSTLYEAMKRTLMVAGSATTSLAAGYWARSLVPLVFTQPIFQVSEMVFPTLVGLYIFGEKKNFTSLGWTFMGIGLVGGIIIATHL